MQSGAQTTHSLTGGRQSLAEMRERLAQYDTTIAEDERLLEQWRADSTADSVHRARMLAIISFRLTEKRLLSKVLQHREQPVGADEL